MSTRKKAFKHIYAFLTICCCLQTGLPNLSLAQKREPQLRFRNINEKHGLSYNFINAFHRDRFGFLWVGTYGGLNRFDGVHFKVYRNNPKDTSSIVNDVVHGVTEDHEGNIWCVTEGGISMLDIRNNKFVNYRVGSLGATHLYTDALCDRQGILWFSGLDGLYRFDPFSKAWRHFLPDSADVYSLSNRKIRKRNIVEDPRKQALWIITEDGLNYFDTQSLKAINKKNRPENPIFSRLTGNIDASKDGYIFALDNQAKKILKIDPSNLSVIGEWQHPLQGNFYSPATVHVDSRQQVWVSHWSGKKIRLNTLTGESVEVKEDEYNEQAFPSSFYWDVYEDEEQTMWFGSLNGIGCYNEKSVFYQAFPFDFTVRSFCPDPDGTWWIGPSWVPKVVHFDPLTGKSKEFQLPTDSTDAVLWMASIKGKCWASIRSGLYMMEDGTRFQRMHIPFIKNEQYYTRRMFVLNDSTELWIYAQGHGIFCYNIAQKAWKKIEVSFEDAATQPYPVLLHYDYQNRPVILYSDYHVARYNADTGSFDKFLVPIADEMRNSPSVAFSAYIDEQNIWIAAKGAGLFRYGLKQQEVKRYSAPEGIAVLTISGCTPDKFGRMWVPSYNKIFVLDPKSDLVQSFTYPVSRSNYEYNNYIQTLPNGHIVSILGKNLVESYPELFPSPISRHKPLINSVDVFGTEKLFHPVQGRLTLSYSENYFNVQYGLLSGLENGGWIYQYRLEGFRDEWVNAGLSTTATFSNVPGGNYTFQVRIVAPDGTWAGEAAELPITVVPPFYKTLWFQVGVAILAALMIGFVIRYRVNNIRKAEAQKSAYNKLVNEWRLKALRGQMNPHFIFNCLNSIDLYIMQNDVDNASRYLNKFARLVRLILDQSEANTVPLKKEIEMLQYYVELEAMRFEHPFKYHFTIGPNIDPAEIEIPSMLLQPHVENAILHGLRTKKEAGNLSLDIRLKGNELLCTITDDGIGRQKSRELNAARTTSHHSMGVRLTEERLMALNKKTSVTVTDLSDSDGRSTGTKVEIIISVE